MTDAFAEITKRLADHYSECIQTHGAGARGVDWRDQATADLRYRKMLAVLAHDVAGPPAPAPTVFDVGCGYGGLRGYATEHDLPITYTGIDASPEMIGAARSIHPEAHFLTGDFLTLDDDTRFDYVVCNGILTQKLATTSQLDMERYAHRLIATMYGRCTRGIAFNLMSSRVNFFAANLFYKSPVETLGHCLEHLSPSVLVDHSYGMFEYTVYVYRPDAGSTGSQIGGG